MKIKSVLSKAIKEPTFVLGYRRVRNVEIHNYFLKIPNFWCHTSLSSGPIVWLHMDSSYYIPKYKGLDKNQSIHTYSKSIIDEILTVENNTSSRYILLTKKNKYSRETLLYNTEYREFCRDYQYNPHIEEYVNNNIFNDCSNDNMVPITHLPGFVKFKINKRIHNKKPVVRYIDTVLHINKNIIDFCRKLGMYDADIIKFLHQSITYDDFEFTYINRESKKITHTFKYK